MFAVVSHYRPGPITARNLPYTFDHYTLFKRWNQTESKPPVPETLLSSEQVENEPIPLKTLSRPLGVAKKPSALPASWKEKREEFMDYDKHLEKRRHLVKEASRGYFQDFHALKQHEGKTWVAPQSLIREDKALYFPDVIGMSLEPQETVHTTSLFERRVSLIAMLSSARSEEHVQSFSHFAVDAYLSHPLFQYVQINLQENLLKGFLVSLFLSSIRKRVPKELQTTYLVSKQNMEYLREPMGMVNKHIGYVYLVDETCKIRWAGCGFAWENEDASLKNCTRVLLQRLAKTPKSSDESCKNASIIKNRKDK